MGAWWSSSFLQIGSSTLSTENVFYFRSCKHLPIFQYCQICKCQRFSDEEVKVLSDSTLSYSTFQTRYPEYTYVTPDVCRLSDCATKKFAADTSGFSEYAPSHLFSNANCVDS